jgi:hypothetical protein
MGGQEPRGRLEPDPGLAAICDLPAAYVVRRRLPLEAEAEEYAPDELAPEAGGVFDDGTGASLR